ncbi:TetR/AcrR family transcriptional regulator [Pseudonocardia parietis]|uniref:AcrR family transcriptional regulator n=1 Tax=Pseudonocardia parietis TaxID=570936 RepID=A0ABS4VU08_9PSEU|nr:TetR/AcrR family transcriptional regulator [Pseudonocardia parietis]MBP2367407.1 AcrR family transcriptional regulator [Pseudonocardia parietis]
MHATSSTVGQERRADARRNITAILDAAQACLSSNPDVSIGEIAKAAGVGRVTLYGHFGSRAELVDATFARVLVEADQTLDAVDLDGDPRDALARLISSSWRIVNRFRTLLLAAQRALPDERVRELHDGPMRRVHELLERGRAERVFRTDLPDTWMVATFYSIMHAAADEIAAGRLDAQDAGDLLVTTLLATFAPATEHTGQRGL